MRNSPEMKNEVTQRGAWKRSSSRELFWGCALGLALVAGVATPAQQPSESTGVSIVLPAPAFAVEDLAVAPQRNWPTNGGDVFNRRYSPLTQVNRENVAGLKAVWRAHLNGSGMGPKFSGETQPIVYEGVIYMVTGANDVFAISVDSGETLWTYRANLNPSIDAVCCGWTSRGLGLGDGNVYLGRLDGKLVALDQRSGAVKWSIQAERSEDGFSITSAPLYYDGLVFTGFAGADLRVRGRMKAFEAKSGALVWTFHTVPGPGEFGHDTWPKNTDAWQHGGAAVWHTPAIDPALGLLYFSTGNAGTDYNGAERRGDNLFSASIVALEAKTGKYRWHFQEVHHDIWDYDAPNPVVLFNLDIKGAPRRALAQAGKTGWVYILDRTTGKPIIGIPERPVPQESRQATAPTQPYPVGDAFVPQLIPIPPEGFRLVNSGRIFTPYAGDGNVVKPGIFGGANWPPSSYDPNTGFLYVCAQDQATYFKSGEATPNGGRVTSVSFPLLGVFAALDMRTNRLVWQQHWSGPCYSGSVVTAGGLVFVGRNDGRLTALDSRNGSLLWQFQTGAGVNAPASVFEHRGQEYVVAYSAGNLFAPSPSGDSVWLFSLAGKLDPVEPARSPAGTFVAELGAADVSKGHTVYDSTCRPCHGSEGEGGHGSGPPLRSASSPSDVMRIVRVGSNLMPGFEGRLSPEQIRDVSSYVSSILAR
jgi:alcohol dehydrogenase (cytochrome c)